MIALTFDTDWVQPADMDVFLTDYEFPGIGTFFLHRPYANLRTTRHELCPHPLPVAPHEWRTSVSRMLDELNLKPKGVRTHSCIHSHQLELVLHDLGFVYTSNTTRLLEVGVAPSRSAWGLWEMPIYYMDNLDLTMAHYQADGGHQAFDSRLLKQALRGDALYVFDFHPLHVALNSPSLDYYLARQAELKTGRSPFELRYSGRGAGTFFRELIDLMRAERQESVALATACDRLRK